jgi:anti-anti-sigma regulatory factor
MVIEEEILNVKQAERIHRDFIRELDEKDEIIMDFSPVKRIDLSIAQLIIAAGREARKTGKVIRLKGVSDHVRWQMNVCGLRV